MRMKNLALAVGLALCLLGNINAFTIWKSLYTDQQLRATFSTPYAEKAAALANAQATQGTDPNKKPTQEELDAQIKSLRKNMQGFLTDVSFGVGRIWQASSQGTKTDQTQQAPFNIFVYEFFGSLLTGILVSIGAPYWHDILQALAALRPDKAKT